MIPFIVAIVINVAFLWLLRGGSGLNSLLYFTLGGLLLSLGAYLTGAMPEYVYNGITSAFLGAIVLSIVGAITALGLMGYQRSKEGTVYMTLIVGGTAALLLGICALVSLAHFVGALAGMAIVVLLVTMMDYKN